jgi:hypothetical protein
VNVPDQAFSQAGAISLLGGLGGGFGLLGRRGLGHVRLCVAEAERRVNHRRAGATRRFVRSAALLDQFCFRRRKFTTLGGEIVRWAARLLRHRLSTPRFGPAGAGSPSVTALCVAVKLLVKSARWWMTIQPSSMRSA